MADIRDEAGGLVWEITPKDPEHSVFLLKLAHDPSYTECTRIQHTWDTVWRRAGLTPPAILVLGDSYSLESLTDDQLQQAGLMRIANPSAAAPDTSD